MRDKSHDLLNSDLQHALIADVQGHAVDFLSICPPCATWSRALLNKLIKGPLPLRSKVHPWGSPWLSGVRKDKITHT